MGASVWTSEFKEPTIRLFGGTFNSTMLNMEIGSAIYQSVLTLMLVVSVPIYVLLLVCLVFDGILNGDKNKDLAHEAYIKSYEVMVWLRERGEVTSPLL